MRSSDPEFGSIADRYAIFSAHEAAVSSETYASLAATVSRSDAALSFLSTLPPERQQPNLFFAALRWTGELPCNSNDLGAAIRQRGDDIRHVMLSRTTQTNEPGRCATLLPLLAQLSQPLALIEVGASAGLCLLFDRYGYDFGSKKIAPAAGYGPDTPFFQCDINDTVPLPDGPIDIAWRRGLDLNPLDVTNSEDTAWLETLVWPEHTSRLENLKAALRIAQSCPPVIEQGNLLHDLSRLAAQAPDDATLVIFHTAVLAYVASVSDRKRFCDSVLTVADYWVSNESPHVVPGTSGVIPENQKTERFVIALNGKPVAWASPHGQTLHWLPG